MKARPLAPYSLLGTEIILDPSKVYEYSHATNQPDWGTKGLVFIHATDEEDCAGVLLEHGEYEIVE